MNTRSCIRKFIQISMLGAAFVCAGQPANVLHGPVDSSTAVRFFFDPGNYFHPPLIFRVVSQSDPRLDTAPLLPAGRTVYISQRDMQKLVADLAALGLGWTESGDLTTFGDATQVPPDYAMALTVISSRGTATSRFDPAKICGNLASLDAALRKPRALWEFQVFRAEYECKVAGLNGQAYPDHWPWNQPQK